MIVAPAIAMTAFAITAALPSTTETSPRLSSTDWMERKSAAIASVRAREKAQVPALRACMNDESVDAFVACAWAAHRLGDPNALTVVSRELEARHIHRRVNAVDDLAEFQDVKTIPLLIAAQRRWPWQARARAAIALGELGDERSAPALAERLADSAWVVRWRALDALGKLARGPLPVDSPPARTPVAPTGDLSPFTVVDVELDSETTVDPKALESTLAPLPPGFSARLRPRLYALLRDEWPAVRGGALAALGRFGTRADHSLIVRGLKSREPLIRVGAMVGAVAANIPGLVKHLTRRLADPNADVALAAARALKKLGETLPASFGVALLARATDRASLERTHAVFTELGPDASSKLFASLVDPALQRNRAARHAAHWLSRRMSTTGVASHTLWQLAAHHRTAADRLYATGHAPHAFATIEVASFASPLPLAPTIAARASAISTHLRTATVARRGRRAARLARMPRDESTPESPPGDDPSHLNTSWPRHAVYNMRAQNTFNAEILAAARELPGLDPLILKALIFQESNFDPWARNDYDCAGLAQFCPYAGRDEGVPPSRKKEDFFNDPRYIPRRALIAAARHLRRKLAALDTTAFRRFGRPAGRDLWAFVLASYNGGERQVLNAMQHTYEKGLAVYDETRGASATATPTDINARDEFARAYARKWANVIGDLESFEDAPLFKMTSKSYSWYRPYGRYAPLAGAAAKYFEIGLFPVEILDRAAGGAKGANRAESGNGPPRPLN
ncbi:MAG: HEAT repeat domain-containing protein [Deltaproteobacteria bacterium]|nr:HEAT repeat domain-containing protein [Deltaproteobacteria bacterium]